MHISLIKGGTKYNYLFHYYIFRSTLGAELISVRVVNYHPEALSRKSLSLAWEPESTGAVVENLKAKGNSPEGWSKILKYAPKPWQILKHAQLLPVKCDLLSIIIWVSISALLNMPITKYMGNEVGRGLTWYSMHHRRWLCCLITMLALLSILPHNCSFRGQFKDAQNYCLETLHVSLQYRHLN